MRNWRESSEILLQCLSPITKEWISVPARTRQSQQVDVVMTVGTQRPLSRRSTSTFRYCWTHSPQPKQSMGSDIQLEKQKCTWQTIVVWLAAELVYDSWKIVIRQFPPSPTRSWKKYCSLLAFWQLSASLLIKFLAYRIMQACRLQSLLASCSWLWSAGQLWGVVELLAYDGLNAIRTVPRFWTLILLLKPPRRPPKRFPWLFWFWPAPPPQPPPKWPPPPNPSPPPPVQGTGWTGVGAAGAGCTTTGAWGNPLPLFPCCPPPHPPFDHPFPTAKNREWV